MKTFKTFSKLVLVAFAVIISTSCNKDEDAPAQNQVPATGSYITAKVDGADFSTTIFGVSTATANRVGTGPNALIQILGADLGANNISITLVDLNIIAGQTYTLNPSLDGSVMAYVSTASGGAFGTGICEGSIGTLVVTAYDNTKIEGTFSFTGKDGENCSRTAKVITNGSFRGVFAI
jgi:hypothetical protein